MIAIIGLGNPGSQYEKTRHNAGFQFIDALALKWELGSAWKSKFGCEYQKSSFRGEDILLIKPQEYMNLSGQTALPLLKFFKVELPEDLLLAYDEVDLDPGRVQLKKGGSAGGHNGVKDFLSVLGGKGEFVRLRLGVGHPRKLAREGETVGGKFDISSWVLACPGPEEKELLEKAVQLGTQAVEIYLKRGLNAAKQCCAKSLK